MPEATSTPRAGKRARAEQEDSPPAAKAPRLPKAPLVGDWVVLRATSRKSVDKLKARTPCLVTLVAGTRVQVLYPNQLSVFLHQQDGEVSVRFRTEKCDLVEVRPYKGESASLLDRRMIVTLCSSISSASSAAKASSETLCSLISSASSAAKASSEAAPTTPPAKAPAEEHRSPKGPESQGRSQAWLLDFTALVAEAFRSEGREVLDAAALRGRLAGDFAEAEIEEGLAALEGLNKVMVADEAVFLVS